MLDLSSLDGKSSFSITAIEHDGEIMIVHIEGIVEGYGILRLSHAYEHLSDRSGWTLSGTPEAILDDGGIASTPHMRTFSRDGGKTIAYGTDFETNGDLKSIWLTKQQKLISGQLSNHSLNIYHTALVKTEEPQLISNLFINWDIKILKFLTILF